MRPVALVAILFAVATAQAREPHILSVEQMIGRVLVIHAHQTPELAPPGHKEGDEPYLDDLMRSCGPARILQFRCNGLARPLHSDLSNRRAV